jgi:hypothetical protein
MTQEIFAQTAREHGLNADRVEAARQKGLTMTTLVQLLVARPAIEVDAMLIPLTLGEQDANGLAHVASVLSTTGSPRPSFADR